MIRRKHREATLGDLYHDRTDWRAEGSSRITIEFWTSWQIFLIVLLRSKKLAFVAAAVEFYRKLIG